MEDLACTRHTTGGSATAVLPNTVCSSGARGGRERALSTVGPLDALGEEVLHLLEEALGLLFGGRRCHRRRLFLQRRLPCEIRNKQQPVSSE